MGILDKFLKKEGVEPVKREGLPEELERFRVPREPVRPVTERVPEIPPREEISPRDREFHRFARDFGEPMKLPERKVPELRPMRIPESERTLPEMRRPEEPLDKLDLVISKLETIDERLKRVEDRLERRVF